MKPASGAADPELPPVRVLIEAWIDKDDRLIMTSFNRSKYFAMNLSSEYAAALKKRSLVFTNKTLEAQQTDDKAERAELAADLDDAEDRASQMFDLLLKGETNLPEGGSVLLTLRALCLNTMHYKAKKLRAQPKQEQSRA